MKSDNLKIDVNSPLVTGEILYAVRGFGFILPGKTANGWSDASRVSIGSLCLVIEVLPDNYFLLLTGRSTIKLHIHTLLSELKRV